MTVREVAEAKLMTTKELANILNVDVRTIQIIAKKILDPTKVLSRGINGGVSKVFNEEQATLIKQEIQKHHNLKSRQIDNVSTELEVLSNALLSYNAYEMKIHRTVEYYKSKTIVIQIQRDISKKNMTEKFVNEVKKMESISNKQIELLTSIYQHKGVTNLQLANIYTKIIDRMYDFYLNESRKYNYFVSVKELKI